MSLNQSLTTCQHNHIEISVGVNLQKFTPIWLLRKLLRNLSRFENCNCAVNMCCGMKMSPVSCISDLHPNHVSIILRGSEILLCLQHVKTINICLWLLSLFNNFLQNVRTDSDSGSSQILIHDTEVCSADSKQVMSSNVHSHTRKRLGASGSQNKKDAPILTFLFLGARQVR